MQREDCTPTCPLLSLLTSNCLGTHIPKSIFSRDGQDPLADLCFLTDRKSSSFDYFQLGMTSATPTVHRPSAETVSQLLRRNRLVDDCFRKDAGKLSAELDKLLLIVKAADLFGRGVADHNIAPHLEALKKHGIENPVQPRKARTTDHDLKLKIKDLLATSKKKLLHKIHKNRSKIKKHRKELEEKTTYFERNSHTWGNSTGSETLMQQKSLLMKAFDSGLLDQSDPSLKLDETTTTARRPRKNVDTSHCFQGFEETQNTPHEQYCLNSASEFSFQQG